ncbi:MAG: glutaredoxin [Thermobacillus sp. ZCTH02-B1]|uniref:glutaredoxin family protein n=1 Tax=Thermobacillus sp. ZCTH02-B1 TaxID=1858795 RepID=UPI000B56E6A5|nr:glutaredoxin [Thermobacillus sp. ZCTH02-B1]OUM96238.1 MAG: glutaredoxin [Thermobacillus sp. ZCTH02-B1]
MKLYTKTVCPRCLWIKSEVRRSGREVEIVDIDKEESARERLITAGVRTVPALEADGRFWTDPEAMLAKLGGGHG